VIRNAGLFWFLLVWCGTVAALVVDLFWDLHGRQTISEYSREHPLFAAWLFAFLASSLAGLAVHLWAPPDA